MAQLLGHDTQHPELVLVVGRAVERHLMLLDGAELGRSLSADDGQEMLGGLGAEIGRCFALGLAGAIPHLDGLRGRDIQLGAQAELLVVGEVLGPILVEQRQVGKVVPAPVVNRVLVLLGQRVGLDLHWLLPSPKGRSNAVSELFSKPSARRNFSVSPWRVSTIVRRRCAPAERKYSASSSKSFLPSPLPRCAGSTPKRSIQPLVSSRPNSPPRTSPSMKPTTSPSISATREASGSRRR